MKWAYSFRERIKAAFLLAIVLVLVFVASMISKRNVSQLGNSFSSVYEDRLVVESYIYKFSDYLYKKKIIVDECSNSEQLMQLRGMIGKHNGAIRSMIASYEKTKLTDEESVLFMEFKKNMEAIMEAEAGMSERKLSEVKSAIDQRVDNALANLDHLSAIQVSEGKILNENSKKIMAGTDVLTQFEMVILIIIGVMIQVLVFASKSFNPKLPQNPGLN